MTQTVTIESGFAEVGAGAWLMGRAQPAAFFGKAVRRRRKGWVVRDRSRLDLVETTGAARLANASRPFLTHIPCAATISAVSDKVLIAPASARLGDQTVKAVPMSAMRALVVTLFGLPPEEVESQKSKVEGPDDATMQRRNDATGESSNGQTVKRSNGCRAGRVRLGMGRHGNGESYRAHPRHGRRHAVREARGRSGMDWPAPHGLLPEARHLGRAAPARPEGPPLQLPRPLHRLG